MACSTLAAVALALTACRHTPPVAAASRECPGPYPIVRGTCANAAATDCHGVCGQVVRRGTCTPVPDAVIVVDVGRPISPSVATDATGHFDLVGIPPGHHELRIMAAQDDGRFEIDVVEGPQSLASPLELTLLDRSCGCGGACPN